MSEKDMPKIRSIYYKDSMNRKQKTYLLSKHEAMIFAAGESNIIKAMVIKYMDNMEFEFNLAISSVEHTKETHDKLYETIKEFKPENIDKEYQMINNFINMSVCKILGFGQKDLTKKDMNHKQLELRAEVEEKWCEYYKGKKSGIKNRIENELM